MRFVKIEGAGNDYVLVETFSQRVADPAGLARAVSDRHAGIGSDGLILVGPPDALDNAVADSGASPAANPPAANPPAANPEAHARMRIFNADGSEGRMCGNGLRCVVRWLVEEGRAPAGGALVQTASGPRRGQPLPDGRWEIELGEPDFTRGALGLTGAGEARLPLPDGVRGDPPEAFGVSVGNPHLVLRVTAPEAEDLRAIGLALGALVPGGANVHLLAVRGADTLLARPWERGSGATQACGTGAVACAVVARRQGWLAADVVRVLMPGGELRVRWSGAGAAWLAGPANLPFRGEWPAS